MIGALWHRQIRRMWSAFSQVLQEAVEYSIHLSILLLDIWCVLVAIQIFLELVVCALDNDSILIDHEVFLLHDNIIDVASSSRWLDNCINADQVVLVLLIDYVVWWVINCTSSRHSDLSTIDKDCCKNVTIWCSWSSKLLVCTKNCWSSNEVFSIWLKWSDQMASFSWIDNISLLVIELSISSVWLDPSLSVLWNADIIHVLELVCSSILIRAITWDVLSCDLQLWWLIWWLLLEDDIYVIESNTFRSNIFKKQFHVYANQLI